METVAMFSHSNVCDTQEAQAGATVAQERKRLQLPEHNDLLSWSLPPLVLLEADVTVVLSWVQSSCDSSTQVG